MTYHTVYKATTTNMTKADPAAITAYIQKLVGPSSEKENPLNTVHTGLPDTSRMENQVHVSQG